MNERIQELITAYLHKGSTPQQEKELFEACGKQPEIAEYLRKHLYLSLKLKQLQENTEVPRDLHNAVLRRVNELEAVSTAPAASSSAMRLSPTESVRRFGWRHVLGSALAAAATMFVLMFLLPAGEGPPPDLALTPVQYRIDTLIVTRTDTITQLREVTKPVYIVKYRTLPEGQPVEDGAQAAVSPQMAVQTQTADDIQPADSNTDASGEDGPLLAEALPTHDASVPSHRPMTADLGEAQTFQTEREKNYLEQYNDMLIAVESVELTSDDRIRY